MCVCVCVCVWHHIQVYICINVVCVCVCVVCDVCRIVSQVIPYPKPRTIQRGTPSLPFFSFLIFLAVSLYLSNPCSPFILPCGRYS